MIQQLWTILLIEINLIKNLLNCAKIKDNLDKSSKILLNNIIIYIFALN